MFLIPWWGHLESWACLGPSPSLWYPRVSLCGLSSIVVGLFKWQLRASRASLSRDGKWKPTVSWGITSPYYLVRAVTNVHSFKGKGHRPCFWLGEVSKNVVCNIRLKLDFWQNYMLLEPSWFLQFFMVFSCEHSLNKSLLKNPHLKFCLGNLTKSVSLIFILCPPSY